MRSESIEALARRLVETLPESLRAVRDDMEQNFRSVLQNGLARLDLVTREEFEVQEAMLARARELQAALGERLSALEAKLPAAEAAAGIRPEGGAKKKKKKKARRKPEPPAG